MRIILAILILQALSQTIEYSSLIYGMLEGARIVDKVSIGRCKSTSSREKRTISIDNLLSDAISLSTSCKWPKSVEILTNFKAQRQATLKAAEELTSFLLSVLDRNPRAMKNDGVSIGQILEPKIASFSPYVLKFRFEGEMLMNKTEKSLPIAVFHGLGDCCCFPGMTEFTRYISKEANTLAKCIEIGDGPTASWLMGFPLQVQTACENLKKVPEYEKGVNLIGLSQGGLLVRALAESCELPIKKVISVGGPQMGLAKTPVCKTGYYCDIYQDAVDMGVYSKVPQSHIGPPGYYKDPTQYETYVEKSGFLAWINNEKEKNSTQFQKFVALESLVLIMFNNDSITDPKITQHFGYYANGSKNILLGLNKTNDYVNDILGLKTLNEMGKVFLETIEGDHLQLTSADVQRTVIPYLF